MFQIVSVLPGLYLVARLLWPMRLPLPALLGLALLVLLVSQHRLFTIWIWGSMMSPEVPRLLAIAVNWLYGAILIGAVLALVLDLGSLLVSALRWQWSPAPATLRIGAGALALAIAAWGVGQAIRVPPVKQVEIALPGLDPAFDGVRLLHLTDLHVSRMFQRPWTERLVAAAMAQRADLILVTGDLIDGTIPDRKDAVAPLAGLEARYGVFVTSGNHEYYFGHDAWMAHYATLGMRELANDHVVLERGGARLVIAGVPDAQALRAGLPGPDVAAALSGAPAGVPVILMDHRPGNARANAAAGADLQLSGHTHGGMVRGLDRIVARFNDGFVSGLYRIGTSQLYVNNGTALWIGFALRLGRPAELTVITLRPDPVSRPAADLAARGAGPGRPV
ncbi:metallophosphoesterase, partial [Mangrovicoccus sp. HB182678]|nr:metallophosphoesterase [Mangrovicoccus algicola]